MRLPRVPHQERNDVGFVTAHGRRYVISMMTKDCMDPRCYADNEGALLLADVSALIYQHFVAGAQLQASSGMISPLAIRGKLTPEVCQR